MPNVIALVQDERLSRQIEQFLEELGLDDLRFASFRSEEEFQELYFRTPSEETPEAPPESEATTDGAELKLFSEIHAVLFAMDTITEKPGAWIDRLKVRLKNFKYWPEHSAPRFIMLKYEDDGISKLDVMHPLLDDLIYLPLDRLVFLQKMQIFLALPQRVSPRFLFNQEIKQEIEISKISRLDRLSDVALALGNPLPLRQGMPAHFYLDLPGEKSRVEMYGKVLRSEPHPNNPGEHLVYFSYFGLSKSGLSQIRGNLSKAPRYQSFIKEARDEFRFNPDALWNESADLLQFGIVIVDPDETVGGNLLQTLTKEMDRINVRSESSYQLFLHKYFEASENRDLTPSLPADASMFFHSLLALTLSVTDLRSMAVHPSPKEEDKFLGYSATELFSTPEGWLRLIEEKESMIVMQEAAVLVSKGHVLQKLVPMKDAEGRSRAVNIKIFSGTEEQTIMAELSPSSVTDIALRGGHEGNTAQLNFAIIDSNFVPEEASSWIEGLRNRAVQVGLCETAEQLKFFLLTDNENRMSASWLASKDIAGMFVKPIDARQMLFLLSELLPNKHTMFRFDNIGWSEPQLPIHVAKKAHLEALSEYGATLKSEHRIVPGTIIYLRKSIFDSAPNQCLAARVYLCEEHPSEKGAFLIHTTYFGINDSFLKFARTWIRENYANAKNIDG